MYTPTKWDQRFLNQKGFFLCVWLGVEWLPRKTCNCRRPISIFKCSHQKEGAPLFSGPYCPAETGRWWNVWSLCRWSDWPGVLSWVLLELLCRPASGCCRKPGLRGEVCVSVVAVQSKASAASDCRRMLWSSLCSRSVLIVLGWALQRSSEANLCKAVPSIPLVVWVFWGPGFNE